MEQDPLTWLQSWLTNRADGTWEHRHGVRIESLDNPGWSVSIDLEETPLRSKAFELIQVARGDSDWLTCRVRAGRFEGFGDPTKLRVIIDTFRAWATS